MVYFTLKKSAVRRLNIYLEICCDCTKCATCFKKEEAGLNTGMGSGRERTMPRVVRKFGSRDLWLSLVAIFGGSNGSKTTELVFVGFTTFSASHSFTQLCCKISEANLLPCRLLEQKFEDFLSQSHIVSHSLTLVSH